MKYRLTVQRFQGNMYDMINRKMHIEQIEDRMRSNKVVAIIGARQVGKTTLARQIIKRYKGSSSFFDLENPSDLSRLADPMLALEAEKGLVVIDEIQRKADLFPVLRVLADKVGAKRRFLILGSASPDLLRQSSESLAGRINYYELGGFDLGEIGISNIKKLWIRGGFPRAFLARTEEKSNEWRRQFITTFLERDIPQLGFNIPAASLRKFWTMLAHYHGQIWNASEFGRSFGISDTTVTRYLDLLTSAYVVLQLRPWQENIKKRQVKSPKVYISDSGILHTLLNLDSAKELEFYPKVGSSWEGFLIREVIRRLKARSEECYFWATHGGAELDLLIVRGRKRIGYEFKRTLSPKITSSMRSALETLRLERIEVIYAGEHTYLMDKKIRAIPASKLTKLIKPL